MCRFPSTHHLNVRWHSGEEVQQLVVVDHVRVAQLLGELIHTCRNEGVVSASLSSVPYRRRKKQGSPHASTRYRSGMR